MVFPGLSFKSLKLVTVLPDSSNKCDSYLFFKFLFPEEIKGIRFYLKTLKCQKNRWEWVDREFFFQNLQKFLSRRPQIVWKRVKLLVGVPESAEIIQSTVFVNFVGPTT